MLSLDINGQSINTLCYDPNILRDIGLNDEMDIILIQTAFVSLSANDDAGTASIAKQPSLKICEDEDEYFPKEWTFPMEDAEKMKNSHYVGQKLMITNKYLHQTISKCIYIENNWIVIQYLIDQNVDENKNRKESKCDVPELSISNQSNSIHHHQQTILLFIKIWRNCMSSKTKLEYRNYQNIKRE